MNPRAILLSLMLILAGCGTTYQSEGFTGGFSDIQLDENIFEISFKGNAFIGKEKVRRYAMLRAAEVTLENGYSYFAIIEENDWTNVVSSTSSGSATTNYQGAVYGNSVSGTAQTTYCSGLMKPDTNMGGKIATRESSTATHFVGKLNGRTQVKKQVLTPSCSNVNQKGDKTMSSPTNDSQATTTQQKANLKPDSDAFKALELEYFKKRRELERKHKAALRTDKAKDIADSKKLVKVMRKRYAMTDDQIAKRLGLKLSVN